MIITKYLGAAGVAVFMLGVAAGYSLTGAEPAPEAARFKVRMASPQISANDQKSAQPMTAAFDVTAPVLAWLQQAAEASN